jgi:hypothetical protein
MSTNLHSYFMLCFNWSSFQLQTCNVVSFRQRGTLPGMHHFRQTSTLVWCVIKANHVLWNSAINCHNCSVDSELLFCLTVTVIKSRVVNVWAGKNAFCCSQSFVCWITGQTFLLCVQKVSHLCNPALGQRLKHFHPLYTARYNRVET